MNFRIRPGEPSDAEQLTRLADAVSAEPEGWLISVAGEWRSAGDERRYLKALRRYPHAAVFVAEDEAGVVVGRLSIGRERFPNDLGCPPCHAPPGTHLGASRRRTPAPRR